MIEAFLLLGAYYAISNLIFWYSMSQADLLSNFLPPAIFGLIAGPMFLYIFGHDDLLKFAKVVEEREMKMERRLLKRFGSKSKLTTSLIIGTIGGPMLAALTVRMLLSSARYRYIIVSLITVPSTAFSVALTKGAFSALSLI